MNEQVSEKRQEDANPSSSLPREDKLTKAARRGELPRLLNAYLQSCHALNGEEGKGRGERFPNLAGFCRSLRCGISSVEELREEYPDLYDHICAVLEDEALNSKVSPTLLSVYLKRRLGYGEPKTDLSNSGEQLKLIFEHDVQEDGE